MMRAPRAGMPTTPLLQVARRVRLRSVSDKPRELSEILYDMDSPERVLRHARLGLTREDPLAAMKRLGELARELELISSRLAQERPAH